MSEPFHLLERFGDYRVVDDDDDDPVLVDPDGQPVDTWREGYPYDDRLSRDGSRWALPWARHFETHRRRPDGGTISFRHPQTYRMRSPSAETT